MAWFLATQFTDKEIKISIAKTFKIELTFSDLYILGTRNSNLKKHTGMEGKKEKDYKIGKKHEYWWDKTRAMECSFFQKTWGL